MPFYYFVIGGSHGSEDVWVVTLCGGYLPVHTVLQPRRPTWTLYSFILFTLNSIIIVVEAQKISDTLMNHT
jgi:hypothetical protein